jgi:predicted RND superfamily exporter protein
VLLPAMTVIISLTWTLGIMVLAGSSLSLGNMALLPLVLVLGDGVFVARDRRVL